MMFHPWGPLELHRGLQQSPWLGPLLAGLHPEEGPKLAASFFSAPSSSQPPHPAATWSSAGARAGWGSGTTGLLDPLLATPGAASIPSASSSLEMPTFGSSSVSEGCRIFQRDAFSSVHSQTDFNRSRSAFTEKQHVGHLVGPSPLY